MTIKDYRLKEFINKDLKVFSNLDNVRSIPSIVDGLKDAQRKAVYGMFRNGISEIKVAQLGSFAAMVSHYAHGEVSMCDTIVGLAQDFSGSNNLNVFEPIGQFGSILSSESSAHRYIFTKPSKHFRKMFKPDDDLILEYRVVDDDQAEPINYFPVLPLWLVNGCEGIGTGHATKILSRNPALISSLIQKIVSGVKPQQKTIDEAMTPWFKNWNGTIKAGEGELQWEMHGNIKKINTTTLRITDLPVTYNLDKFKAVLIKLIDEGKVKDFDNNSTDKGFDIEVTVPREIGRKTEDELKVIFKLVKVVSENVTLWDVSGKLRRYDNAYEALNEFIEHRITVYETRRVALLRSIEHDIDVTNNKIAFISYWNNSMVDPHKKSYEQLSKELEGVVDEKYIDMLLSMQIRSLTMEKVKLLEEELQVMKTTKAELEKAQPSAMFCGELGDF